MKHKLSILAAALVGFGVQAQVLSIKDGETTYYFPASDQKMMFSGGDKLTIGQKTFDLAEFSEILVSAQAPVAENQILINYAENKVRVDVHGGLASYISVAINGSHVSISQSSEVSETTCGEITYILVGETANGSFTLSGSYKASIELAGVSITNPAGPAIDIQNGKRISVSANAETENNLIDGPGAQKGCLYCKGHLELKGKGTLNVTGNQSHAVFAKEYLTVKNLTLNIPGSAKDAINCNQYFAMESGTIAILNAGDDGIQVSYKDEIDREAEDTGAFNLNGGKININIAQGEASKGIKADGDINIAGGEISIVSSCNGIWDSTNLKTKASACIGADGNVTVSGGTLDLKASGSGGKGISCDGIFTCNGGETLISTSGGLLVYSNGSLNHNYTSNAERISSNYKSSAKGIKADAGLAVNNGKITVYTATTNAEGLESKNTLEIHGGEVFSKAYDDGMNSSKNLTITAGKVTAISTVGDAIDSNANLYVSGGEVIALGAGGAEQGLDAADESQCYVYITGGNVLAYGGRNSPVQQATGSQALVTVSGSLTAKSEVSVSNSDQTLATFSIPDEYGTSSGSKNAPGGGPGGGWNPGGGTSGSGNIMISCPEMASGSSYTVRNGSSSSTATAKTTVN